MFCIRRTQIRGRGFTLIELLIVVAIIAILAAIAVPNFLEAQTRAKVSRARADMRTEATALEMYRIDSNQYPRPFDAFHNTPNYYTRGGWHEHVPSTLSTPISYLGTIPQDPFKPLAPPTQLPKVLVQGRHFYYNHDFAVKAYQADSGSTTILADYREFEKAVGMWAMFSYGPDRIYYNEPPDGTAHTRGQFLNYDATNGTLSRGNIIMCQKSGERAGPLTGYSYP